MNQHLKLTPAGANLIKHFEGCLTPHQGKYKSYRCPAGVWTLGWGSTGPPHGRHKIDANTIWTRAQCDVAFLTDMEEFEKDVRRLVKGVQLEPWQFDALVSFTYNVGAGNLAKSTLLKRVNAKDPKAYEEFIKWNKANGKVLAGLTRRRKSEALLYQHITDENYDGVADKPHLEDHPMPQAVDEPED